MAGLKVFEHNPHKPRYSVRLTEDEWERYKPMLTSLDQQGLPRREVLKVAAQYHGFQGTYAAMITRFRKWGLTIARGDTSLSRTSNDSGTTSKTPMLNGSIDQGGSIPDTQRSDSALGLCEQHEELGAANIDVNVIPPTEDATRHASETTADDLDALIFTARAITLEPVDEVKLGEQADTPEPQVLDRASMLAGKNTVPVAAEEADWMLGDPYLPPIHTLSKRSRVPSSSMRSSLSNASSDIRQFLHLAKRLRREPGTPSTQRLSIASSRDSHNFAAVTGLGPELESIAESTTEADKVNSSPLDFLLRRRKPNRRSKSQELLHSQRSISDCPVDTNIPDHEFTSWQDLNLSDFRMINTALRAQTRASSHTARLAVVTRLPLVTIPEASVLAKKYPMARAMLLSSWHDELTLYYLLAASSVVIEVGRLPLLSDAVGEASRRFERWRKFDKNPLKIEL